MGQQLKGSFDSMTYEVRSASVRRLAVNIVYNVTGGATLIPKLDAVKLTLTLRRNGRETTIFSDDLRALLLESNFLNSGEYVYNDGAALSMAATKYLIPAIIDLGGTINLKGDDCLTLEGTLNSAWLPNAFFTGTPVIDFQWRDDIGVEEFIPRINSRAITTNATKWDEYLGDNVTQVSFISIPPTTLGGAFLTDATAVITQLKISTDKVDYNDDTYRMIGRRATQFENKSTGENRYRSFCYPFKGECNGVKVELLLNSGNVAAGEQRIMWRSFDIDPHTFRRAQAMKEKHEAKDVEKLAKAGAI